MRILHIQKVKALVGSEKYFLKLIPELEKNRVKTHFVCIINEPDRDKAQLFLDAYKNTGHSISFKIFKSDKSIFSILKFIKQELKFFAPDIVHSHLIHADFWMSLIKRRGNFNGPIISTKHGYDEDYISRYGFDASYIKPNLYYRLAKFSEKYIRSSYAVSHGLRKLFVDAKISDPERISVIHHGFDLPNLDEKKYQPIRKSSNQILVVGRIIPFKGHKHLIRAMPVILESIPDAHLTILGHGDEDLIHYLTTFCQEKKISEQVSFEGYKTNVYDYFLGSDVMVVPSIAEGFGLIFLEALNAKLPIVGFDVPATNEIIEHNVNGLLTEPYDENELAKNIVHLLSQKEMAVEMGIKGHQFLKEKFSLKRMTSETIECYLKVLS